MDFDIDGPGSPAIRPHHAVTFACKLEGSLARREGDAGARGTVVSPAIIRTRMIYWILAMLRLRVGEAKVTGWCLSVLLKWQRSLSSPLLLLERLDASTVVRTS